MKNILPKAPKSKETPLANKVTPFAAMLNPTEAALEANPNLSLQ